MFNTRTFLFTLPVLSLACGGLEGDLELAEESSSEDALTVVLDNCASGEDANAYIDPRQGWTNLYERSASSINSSCRDTTIVDFYVRQGHIYEFFTTSTFPTAHSISECHDSYIHMRLLRKSGSSWVEEESLYGYGEWNFDFSQSDFGDCVAPRVDARNWLANGTTYRVRARAYRHDGTYSKMIIGLFQ